MENLTNKQHDILRDNLHAYCSNFVTPRIEPAETGEGFYVFPSCRAETYIQFCENIDYLNGWLYGAVQAKCKCMQTITREV